MARKILFPGVLRVIEKMWRTLVLGVIVIAVLAVSGAQAPVLASGSGTNQKPVTCAPFPRIALWRSLDHDFARRTVNEIHGGNWQAYIDTLQGYEFKLRAIQERGTTAVVLWKNSNIRLKGPDLADFLDNLERRIEVTRCLAGMNDTKATDVLAMTIADFTTAAGGPANMGTDGASGRIMDGAMLSSQIPSCGLIPDVAWWKFRTHGSIAGYVHRRYRGNWQAYIGTWKSRLKKLQDIQNRGASAVTSTGIMLRGVQLAGYIDKVQTRISVTRCLAKLRGGRQT